jgi:ferric-dicitrate binding protein FerR (iron transport regulator)
MDHLDYAQYTAEQLAMDDYFQQWVQQSDQESNRFWLSWLEQYPHRRQEVQQARQLVILLRFREDAPPLEEEVSVWNRIKQTQEASEQPERRVISPWWGRVWAVRAAMLSGLVLLGSLLYLLSPDQDLRYRTTYGQTQRVTLPDGSVVTLNANSQLKVRNSWGLAPPREVWLEGEGFFSVARQAHPRKFTVHTDELTVEVLGTKFNVAQRRNRTTVVLSEGKVKLTANAGRKQTVLMQPGDYIELSAQDTAFNRKTVIPEKYTVWKENELFFENAPLPEVLQKVEDYYGIKIILQDTTAAEKRFTSSLPNKNLDVVLKSIAAVYQLEVSRKQNQVILR